MRSLYIPDSIHKWPRVLPWRDDADEVVITREADCGPIEEVYRWDVEDMGFRIVNRRRLTRAECWREKRRTFRATSTRTS